MKNILEVRGLCTEFYSSQGNIRALSDISFSLAKGKVLGLVGESGSGKSTVALSILRILDENSGKVVKGSVLLDGEDIMSFSEEKMQKIRGNKISMIFQDPMTSLNPLYTIGDQIKESIILHQNKSNKEAEEEVIELLKLVSISAPEKRIDYYPHQISGGMRQRVMIAMSLACNPEILIADEPTTALDVTIQAQIVDLLKKIQEERGMSIIFISHDLGVISEICTDVAVMYCGKIVEYSEAEKIFRAPTHPYTAGLLNSLPKIDSIETSRRLPTIEGMVPSLNNLPKGCAFQTRCKYHTEKCFENIPELEKKNSGSFAACFNPLNDN